MQSFTYLHMLQFILFFFVFSAPFVFTTTFHWIGYVPSVIVAIGFYGINEMGKLIRIHSTGSSRAMTSLAWA